MEADFSGWATKAGLKCSDGRTIMPQAFQHQDKVQVPLVWQHGHTDPENVLGHAILEHRDEGVYAYGFFNDSTKAKHAKSLLQHKDINMLSIWANELIERGGRVLHGLIREVSLVLSGANPGALIENVTIRHSDGDEERLDEEAIIYTGLELEHSAGDKASEKDDGEDNTGSDDGDGDTGSDDGDDGNDDGEDEQTIQDIIDGMSEEEQGVLHYMVGEALKAGSSIEQSGTKKSETKQSKVSATGSNDQKGKEVKHNVFEDSKDNKTDLAKPVLSHADVKGILADATKNGSLKNAVENYALAHGIENISVLFPEVRLLESTPEFLSRRMEWVNSVLSGTRKSPFSRVKTVVADITYEEARALGYIKGSMKKEEYFAVSRRVTTPSTIYKKQKLDRDDILDITDFDVITWIQGEMRLMLDEELAGAILVGDGRDVASEDKISETNIRPILKDDDFYSVKVNIDLTSANTKTEDFMDQVLLTRELYKGTGTPTMFTTLSWLTKMLLIRDSMGRKIYPTKADLVSALMVTDIVPVEIMETRAPNVIAILVNLSDYNIGTDKGGEVNFFDFFDIDFNQQKYLLETRCSGALTRPRAAMVYTSAAAGGDVAATASGPAWDAATYTVTIPADANVEYVNADSGVVLAAGAIVLDPGEVLNVRAVAAAGHYLTNTKVLWSFLRPSS